MTAGAPVGTFRKYVYDPADVPREFEGKLQPPAAQIELTGGILTDSLGAGTLTVYTTAP
jgi:hypothetical protein